MLVATPTPDLPIFVVTVVPKHGHYLNLLAEVNSCGTAAEGGLITTAIRTCCYWEKVRIFVPRDKLEGKVKELMEELKD